MPQFINVTMTLFQRLIKLSANNLPSSIFEILHRINISLGLAYMRSESCQRSSFAKEKKKAQQQLEGRRLPCPGSPGPRLPAHPFWAAGHRRAGPWLLIRGAVPGAQANNPAGRKTQLVDVSQSLQTQQAYECICHGIKVKAMNGSIA